MPFELYVSLQKFIHSTKINLNILCLFVGLLDLVEGQLFSKLFKDICIINVCAFMCDGNLQSHSYYGGVKIFYFLGECAELHFSAHILFCACRKWNQFLSCASSFFRRAKENSNFERANEKLFSIIL